MSEEFLKLTPIDFDLEAELIASKIAQVKLNEELYKERSEKHDILKELVEARKESNERCRKINDLLKQLIDVRKELKEAKDRNLEFQELAINEREEHERVLQELVEANREIVRLKK